jgi:predicted RNA-binding protein YlqC (UPF0109 family)
LKELVTFVADGLGLPADSIEFDEAVDGNEVRLTARLPYEGVLKLDGRDHRTAKALRQVLSAAATAQDKRFVFTAEAQD